MAAALPRLARIVNGWQMNIETMGVYGNSYVKRAIVAMIGIGVNAADDAVHPLAMNDADGDPFDGNPDYVLRYDADEHWPSRADAAPVRPSQGRPHRGVEPSGGAEGVSRSSWPSNASCSARSTASLRPETPSLR